MCSGKVRKYKDGLQYNVQHNYYLYMLDVSFCAKCIFYDIIYILKGISLITKKKINRYLLWQRTETQIQKNS
jgi:hypothetical protein